MQGLGDTAEASLCGRVLGGRWTLLRLLGRGGTASVYEAAHRNGKRVAIKVLRADRGGDPSQRSRFLNEGYIANRVEHPAVVSIDDDGEEPDGTAFLVMELLEGETVEQFSRAAGGRVPWRTVVDLSCQLLEVLVAAHHRGIVHRDLKPGNLFVSPTGTLRVLDFGLARALERSQREGTDTSDGALLGTPAFMAPEQARASLATIGPHTDLWAVAATAFSLITGRHVHEAPTLDEQIALASVASAPSLQESAPEVPNAVAQVFERALEYDPRARWPSASAMLAALRGAVAGEPAAFHKRGPDDAGAPLDTVRTVSGHAPPHPARSIPRTTALLIAAALAVAGLLLALRWSPQLRANAGSVPQGASSSRVALNAVPNLAQPTATASMSASASQSSVPSAAPSLTSARRATVSPSSAAIAPRPLTAPPAGSSSGPPAPVVKPTSTVGLIETPPF